MSEMQFSRIASTEALRVNAGTFDCWIWRH